MLNIRRSIYKLLPDKLKFTASSIWENYKNGKAYYSQFGEDVILKKIFEKKKDGFYVDIGAHHPKKYSNTYMLHKCGWTGINIDANPKSIEIFKESRPNDINLNIGINDTASTLTYYEFADPAVNTFSETQAKHWIENEKWNKFLGSTKMAMEPINEVLNKWLPKETAVDLLSIDVEGLDLQILKSLDLSKYKPQVIVVEDHNFKENEPEKSETYQYLIQNGFKLYCSLGFSLIFKIKA